VFANFFGSGQINRTGVRLFLGDAGLGQILDQDLGLDLELASQFVDANLIRVSH
jgi:hypothetical protein